MTESMTHQCRTSSGGLIGEKHKDISIRAYHQKLGNHQELLVKIKSKTGSLERHQARQQDKADRQAERQ